jgi:uncharacterized protein (TIGR02594 family)
MKIAKKFGVSFEHFSALNPGLCQGTQCHVLQVGQAVNVPGPGVGTAPRPAQPVFQPQHQPQEQPSFRPQSAQGPPPWMSIATREVGQREYSSGDNERILQYLASVGIRGRGDEMSWCAAFVNWCLRSAGMPSANTGLAANWASFGRAVQPVYGAIVVTQPLSAGASGHVGFLHAIVGEQVWLLSGNSANAVRISPYHRSKLITRSPFRWPV